jgi:hypothetical protein
MRRQRFVVHALPRLAQPKDTVSLLALQKIRAAGESPSGSPFPCRDLVIDAVETGPGAPSRRRDAARADPGTPRDRALVVRRMLA